MLTLVQNGKKAFAGMVIAVLCAVAFAPAAYAQTYYYPAYTTYGAKTQSSAEIQGLLNQLYALIAQLQSLQSVAVKNYTYTYTPTPTKKIVQSDWDTRTYDVEVETDDVDSDDDEATFYGEVELDDAPYAHVWFAYGQDGDMDEETKTIKMTDDGDFEIEVDDLDEDERYYVRAVVEGPSGQRVYGRILAFTSGSDLDDDDENDDDDDDDDDDDIPDVDTLGAEDVDEDSAELHGEVAMNDFEDGLVFFVYGEDEDAVSGVEDEDTYSDIDEDGDSLQKFNADSSLDGTRTYWASVFGLDEDTDHYFRICVEYEDEDGDETLECGDVEEFSTDEN